jgi:small-conductance mechanosensitive channel
MHDVRSDARRACEAHRERAVASPAPVAVPLALTAVAIVVTAVVSSLLDLSLGERAGVVAAAFVGAALVAHRTMLSLIAGLALIVIRPYGPGERLGLQSPADGDHVEAVIVHIGAVNTTLATDTGLLVVANARLLKGEPEPACIEKSMQA